MNSTEEYDTKKLLYDSFIVLLQKQSHLIFQKWSKHYSNRRLTGDYFFSSCSNLEILCRFHKKHLLATSEEKRQIVTLIAYNTRAKKIQSLKIEFAKLKTIYYCRRLVYILEMYCYLKRTFIASSSFLFIVISSRCFLVTDFIQPKLSDLVTLRHSCTLFLLSLKINICVCQSSKHTSRLNKNETLLLSGIWNSIESLFFDPPCFFIR